MTRERILVVDDEEDLLELVNYNLTKEGFRVTCAASGERALKEAQSLLPDLIVLDLLLPRVDGLEVCRLLKADPQTKHIPIVMLTAKTEESDIVRGLDLGADDYITKPFSPRVLVARIKSVLRRKPATVPDRQQPLTIHNLTIDPGRHEVLIDNKPVQLTFTEFRLLHFLASKPGWAFTRSQIVDAVKGEDYPVTERSVDVQVTGLRRKLGDLGSYIETVRGVGYRFKQ
jgi:two-component system, OmpR family, alkaline phosphatase synthesis response regulator PhoP